MSLDQLSVSLFLVASIYARKSQYGNCPFLCREPYREDFVQETVFLEALADESEEIKRQMGYTLSELVVDCSFGGKNCKSR